MQNMVVHYVLITILHSKTLLIAFFSKIAENKVEFYILTNILSIQTRQNVSSQIILQRIVVEFYLLINMLYTQTHPNVSSKIIVQNLLVEFWLFQIILTTQTLKTAFLKTIKQHLEGF
jgi:hypothetical protein